ncbi:TPA: helix-turn-helix transcriptional regulator [Escherichia coli]|nr:helix-turn-helix transcriptional regulator [Escherichia coli]
MSNLRKYRESLNISQTTLAKAVGCTQGAIGHWESGRRFHGIFRNKPKPTIE